MSLSKDQARSLFKEQRKRFASDAALKEQAEQRVVELIIDLLNSPHIKTVATYKAFASEINIDALVEAMPDKTWVYPRVSGKSLLFYRHTGSFELGAFGVEEPPALETNQIDIKDIDCVLVPGVAFDQRGKRLGMGKGFYDRTLALMTAEKVGIGFRVQMSGATLPAEEHDVEMDYLVNEDFILQPSIG